MSGELGHPPRRALPDDVRARMRERVSEGIARPRRAARAWYAAAAAVVLVVTGAAVVTQLVRQPAEEGPAGGITTDPEKAASSLDRCWAAVKAAGKTDRVPARGEWIPLFSKVQGPVSVVAVTAAGKPMFCETTVTTVTLSDPDATPAYAPGTRTGILLHSATGFVGGIADPAWPHVVLEVKTDWTLGRHDLEFSPVTRQFAGFTWRAPGKTQIGVHDGRLNDMSSPRLPPAPAPLLSTVDRPPSGVDRTSPAGRKLGDCLAHSEEVVPDAANYRPSVLLEGENYKVVLGRHGDRGVVCTDEPDVPRPDRTMTSSHLDMDEVPQRPPRRLVVEVVNATHPVGRYLTPKVLFVGMLPATARTVTCDFGVGSGETIDVVEGMFGAWIPEDMPTALGAVHVQARDANGTVVFDGTL